MENFEKFENYSTQEEKVNYRKVFNILQKNWFLILSLGILGFIGGYLYNLYSRPTYRVIAAIYAPQKSAGMGTGLEDLFKMKLSSDKTEVYNQIEIIKSFNINLMTAQNLNWRTSWYKKDNLTLQNLFNKKVAFNWENYYKDEPFQVHEKEGAFNLPGIRLYVKPLTAQQYELTVQGEVQHHGSKKSINFVATANYGQPFENDYFHFTLASNNPIKEDTGCHYYFVFNDPAQIAHNYLGNLVVKLNDKQSEIIRLQLLGSEPERDNDYLNKLIWVYMQNKMSFQTETQKKSLQFIDNQLVGISDSLNSASSNFSQFKSQNQIINIGEQGTQVMSTLRDIETDKNKNQMQLDYFRNMFDYLGKSDDVKQLIAPSVVGIQDVSLNTMVVGLSELYSRRQILAFSAKENNPTLVMVDKEIAQTNARLKENLRNLIKNAETLNNSFASQKDKINIQLNRLPKKEQDLIHFQRRFDMTNEIYSFLLQKRAEIAIALAGANPEVQVIDAARMDTIEPVGLSFASKLMIGLLFGLTLPSVCLVAFYSFSNTIQSQEDIEKNTQIPVLGNVIHSLSKSNTVVNDNPRSKIAELYRTIRTNLQFMSTDDNKKIIAIHSTNPGEGKSFTSINLATILAKNYKKVILIDVDMRKSRMHTIFNVPNNHGLSTNLSRQDLLDDVIFETSIENLSLIPAGPLPPNPSELLGMPEMEILLSSLRTRYDYIILDNAPISLVTDGLLAGRHADLNIFILRYGVSKTDQIKYINQIAEKKVINNLALIINDINGPGFGYGQNYAYKNYSYGNGYYDETEKSSPVKRIFGRKVRPVNS